MPLRRVAVAMIAFLTSCQEREVDPFFSQPRSEWVAKASTLQTREVYRLYKASIGGPRPWDGRLAQALGPRGKEAIVLWVEDLESGDGLNRLQEFAPIFHYVFEATGYSICSDQALFSRASRAMSIGYRINTANGDYDRLIRSACRS